MTTGRLEAFSDGVIAIIITIMVLEFKVPEGNNFYNLYPLLPKFLTYLISFIYVGIYWNNHHHLFHVINKVNGKILWANLSLLFTLSFIPFTTAWMGESHIKSNPVCLYGINLLLCSIMFVILEKVAIKHEGKDAKITKAIKRSIKEYISSALYIVGIILSFYLPIVGLICYAIVACIWLVPDKRIEKLIYTEN
jgi:uncharacterized membrane protein